MRGSIVMEEPGMAPDPIHAYLEVKRTLQAATDRVEKMVRTIHGAEGTLRAWDRR